MKCNLKTVIKTFIFLSLTTVTACKPIPKKEVTKIKPQETKTASEYNIADLEQYAACVNQLAAKNNMSAFLWDCSTYMDRKTMSNKYPSCVKKMIEPYSTEYKNTGDNSVFEEESAFDAVKNFGAGWNLGNTLDSTSFNIQNVEKNIKGWILMQAQKNADGHYNPASWEKAWGQVHTSQEIADFVLNAGFKSIRIPITWAEHLDENDQVDSLWMARVKETVDYFYNRGVYVIINVHHDGGESGWVEASEKSYKNYNQRFSKLWTQIANTFANYDERLLFEAVNEVLDGNNSWTPNAEGCKWVNAWNQLFVNTVRATGGNNLKRNLVVMTYAGNGERGTFINFKLPEDSVKNHLIMEVHNYDPQQFTWTTVTWTKMTAKWKGSYAYTLMNEFEIYKEYSEKYGAPVIVGEYCADPKKYSDYDK